MDDMINTRSFIVCLTFDIDNEILELYARIKNITLPLTPRYLGDLLYPAFDRRSYEQSIFNK